MKLPVRILLIDSHVQERRLTRRILRSEVPKVAVREVGDLGSMVQALDEEPPVVALAERDLGWGDGLALLSQVKQKWPGCHCVLFTAASLDETLAGGKALRFDAILRKDPAGWNTVASLVLDLVAQARERALATRRVDLAQAAATAGVSQVTNEPVASQPEAAVSRPAASPPEGLATEETGASTLDWFPEMEESEAEEEARAAATRTADGPVHQLLPAVNLESVILTAMSQLKSLIRSTRARVRAGPLPTLRLDRTDGLTLFRNLIANAIEHTGGKLPVVTIHAERRDSYWLLSVHDNGIGIAGRDVGEALHLIHPPGDQDEDSDEGGLAMCGQVARRYGGTLWVQPRDGGGTSVYVALCTTEADSSDDVTVTVQYQGRDMGRISVSSLSNKQQIAGRALELPRLRTALSERGIKDVVFVDADVVKVVA